MTRFPTPSHSLTPFCALAIVAATGCMTTPNDGDSFAATTTAINFGGYTNTANQAVSVRALNPTTNVFSQFATATTGSSPTVAWDNDWYPWSVNAVVPATAWVAGSSGARATIRAQRVSSSSPTLLVGVNERYLDCAAQSDTLDQFDVDCTESSSVTICTTNYLPFGSRRSPCPRRGLIEHRADGDEVFHTLPDTTTTIVLSGVPTSLQYRGDAVSFIDVFDRPATSDGIGGVGGANVVRIRYPNSRSSTSLPSFNPAALATSLGGLDPSFPWNGARVVRQYDLGQCSFSMPWRTVLDLLQPAVESSVDSIATSAAGTVTLVPLGRSELRAILRADGVDAVRYAANFNVVSSGLGDVGNLYLGFNVRLSATAGNLVATLETTGTNVDFDSQGLGRLSDAFGLTTEEEVEADIRGMLASLVRGAISSVLPSQIALVDIDRVHLRADAIDLVLAETTQDPQFGTINSASGNLCQRTDPMPGGNQGGLHFSLFDPPLPTDRRPLGDTP